MMESEDEIQKVGADDADMRYASSPSPPPASFSNDAGGGGWNAVKYMAAYSLPLTAVLGWIVPDIVTPYFTLIFSYGIVPVLDLLLGVDNSNPINSRVLRHSRLHRYTLYLWIPIQIALLAFVAYGVGHDDHSNPADVWHFMASKWSRTHLLLGGAISVGFVAAGGINVSHELFHKTSRLEQYLARVLLASVLYSHFELEHKYGHHKRVATPDDPASARRGESFYNFFPRSVFGGLRSALQIRRRILRGELGANTKNDNIDVVVAGALVSLAFALMCFALGGARGVFVFLVQALIAVVVLEKANYIEHYGLTRAKLSNGSYAAVDASHSWDAPQFASNYLLFKLQRHADHHLHAIKPYQCLNATVTAPQLPTGYPALAFLLMFPFFWRLAIHPRLDEYQARCTTTASTKRASTTT